MGRAARSECCVLVFLQIIGLVGGTRRTWDDMNSHIIYLVAVMESKFFIICGRIISKQLKFNNSMI